MADQLPQAVAYVVKQWLTAQWRRLRYARGQGVVTIECWGQLTSRPQVSVSIQSRRGAQSVYTYEATQQGIARAKYEGHGLAQIAGLPVADRT